MTTFTCKISRRGILDTIIGKNKLVRQEEWDLNSASVPRKIPGISHCTSLQVLYWWTLSCNITNCTQLKRWKCNVISNCCWPCQVGLLVSVSASRMVGRGFTSRPGHTKGHHKNGTNCLPALHACVRAGVCSAARLSKDRVVCGTVYGDMHLKDPLESIERVGYCIPVPDFYLVLQGLCCRKRTIMDWSINQSINQSEIVEKVFKSIKFETSEKIHPIDALIWNIYPKVLCRYGNWF